MWWIRRAALSLNERSSSQRLCGVVFSERAAQELKGGPRTVEIYSADWKKYQEVRQKTYYFFFLFSNSEKVSARHQSNPAQGDSGADACQVVQRLQCAGRTQLPLRMEFICNVSHEHDGLQHREAVLDTERKQAHVFVFIACVNGTGKFSRFKTVRETWNGVRNRLCLVLNHKMPSHQLILLNFRDTF